MPVSAPPRRYNNKTYRVDDIDWDQNPNSTFKKADGSEVSFLEYYRKVRSRPGPLAAERAGTPETARVRGGRGGPRSGETPQEAAQPTALVLTAGVPARLGARARAWELAELNPTRGKPQEKTPATGRRQDVHVAAQTRPGLPQRAGPAPCPVGMRRDRGLAESSAQTEVTNRLELVAS